MLISQFTGLDEHRGPIELVVKGTIPAWTAGSLYRNGPGMDRVEGAPGGTHYVKHWFDGFAHSHKFEMSPSEDGKAATVAYSSRRQSANQVEEIKKLGYRSQVGFGQGVDPCMGVFSKFMSVFRPNIQLGNNNVAIFPNFPGLKDKTPAGSGHRTGLKNMYLSTDSAVLQEINPDTLEPLGFTDQSSLHPALKGPLSCGHAQRDPETGDWFNYNLAFYGMPTYRVFRVSAATGKTDIIATIADPDISGAYIHSFFLTENYVVICIPVSHIGWMGAKIMHAHSILGAIKPFDAQTPCRWLVIDRKTDKGVVARFQTPASFFFHTINAFETKVKDDDGTERTEIHLDYVRYNTSDILWMVEYDVLMDRDDATKKYYFSNDRYKTEQASIARYSFRLPPNGQTQSKSEAKIALGKEEMVIPGPHGGELPTINPRFATKQHRYAYSIANRGLSTFQDCIVKTDMETQDAVIWSGGQGHTPGEPIFVERPGAAAEDDGVLLSVVLDGAARKSYLVCLDARTMEEMGRAEAEFAIAMGFHGVHAKNV